MLISLPVESTIPVKSRSSSSEAPDAASLPLLTAAGLEIGHDGVGILPPIDLAIDRAVLWAVVGPNGSGKSTFVRTILGLDRPIRGTVTRAPDLRAAYMPQQATLDPIFPIRVLEFVLMGRIGHKRAGRSNGGNGGNGGSSGLMGPPSRDDVGAARAALHDVRASELERYWLA